MIAKLFCLIGLHGPKIWGNTSSYLSQYTAPCERTCRCCGKKWYGGEVVTRNCRTLGGWTPKKAARD